MKRLHERVKERNRFVIPLRRMSICCGQNLTTMSYCDIVRARGMAHLEPKVCLPVSIVNSFQRDMGSISWPHRSWETVKSVLGHMSLCFSWEYWWAYIFLVILHYSTGLPKCKNSWRKFLQTSELIPVFSDKSFTVQARPKYRSVVNSKSEMGLAFLPMASCAPSCQREKSLATSRLLLSSTKHFCGSRNLRRNDSQKRVVNAGIVHTINVPQWIPWQHPKSFVT
jgi:hypothetical protein